MACSRTWSLFHWCRTPLLKSSVENIKDRYSTKLEHVNGRHSVHVHACIAVIPWRTGRGCWGSQTPRSAGCQKTVSAWLLPVRWSESPSATPAVSDHHAFQNLGTKGLSQFIRCHWLVDLNIQSNVCRQSPGNSQRSYQHMHKSIIKNVKRMELNIV